MNTTGSRASYRPLPSRNVSSAPAFISKKRKHTSKPQDIRPFHYLEDSSDENEDTGHASGDGSSSGDSIAADALENAKRQRTSRITTRSLARIPAPDLAAENPSDSLSANTTATMPANPTQPASALANTSDDESSNIDTHITDSPRVETAVANITSADITVGTGTNVAITSTKVIPEVHLSAPVAMPPSSVIIDKSKVPAFLLSHGKGARQVDIFAYLNKIQDTRFRQLLFYYIQFEANDKSGVGGTLPTVKRPPEISQWSSRARPSNCPDFTNGKRTFQMFIDSVFEWWGSIQPTWRSFARGHISREVDGGWEVLHTPRINGLLNVVILAYWWVRILGEVESAGSSRVDYEFFAEDVAWVFSKLST